MPKKSGPKGPSKLTEEVAELARHLYGTGKGLRAVARELGLDPSTVCRALPPRPAPQPCGALVPLATPLPRTTERDLARAGVLLGAEPVITEGASLPFAGALVVLPTLLATGLLDAFAEVYQAARAAFYSLSSLVLTMVFCHLVGEVRAEGLSRLAPADIARLDRPRPGARGRHAAPAHGGTGKKGPFGRTVALARPKAHRRRS